MSKYSILGAGMQGTAVAYDLAKFTKCDELFLGDSSLDHARKSAERVNKLIGKSICKSKKVDALDPVSLKSFLADADVVVSCVPYWMHPKIAPYAIETRTHMVDMGGDTRVARKTLALNSAAKSMGVSIIPDTGLAPGLVNNLGAYLMEKLDAVETVKLYCGGLPQNPQPPLNYQLVFNIEGLVTEYMDQADVLRNGKLQLVDTLTENETLEIEGLGTMEAFVTSGGASTAPETYKGKVKNYEYKTIRYPGHCEIMKMFKNFGFWNSESVETRHGTAIPREVFCTLMDPVLRANKSKDLVIVRAVAIGTKDGKECTKSVDILQKSDDSTGFTAMEQLTGFSTSIYAQYAASGVLPPGCHRYETAMTGLHFVTELRRRGIKVKDLD